MSNQTMLENPTKHEQSRYKDNRELGLKIFIEGRLLRNAFMKTHTVDYVKELARAFDKKGGTDFDVLWEDHLGLIEKIKSEKMIDYGKNWDKIHTVHSNNRYEELRFYIDGIFANKVIVTEFKDSIRDAALLYNQEHLEPPLDNTKFDQAFYESETRIQYLQVNKMVPCFCEEHKDSEITKSYDVDSQKKVALDFIESDICKEVNLLHYIESILEEHSMKEIRQMILDFNNQETGLDHHQMGYIWNIAVGRSSDKVLKKVALDIVSHGKNTCQHPGCNCTDIDQLELCTIDGRIVKDMTKAELEEYDREQDKNDKNSWIGKV